MGYYTDYTLEIKGEYKPEDIVKALLTVGDKDDKYFYEELLLGYGINAKWYDSSKEMVEVSKLFPDLIFTLYGNGEEVGDLWVEYFKNGKFDYQKAVLPAYDENRLK